jgi:hypothetical protein
MIIKGVSQTKPRKPLWPIMLLLLGAVITVGAFYYLSLGMPHQLFLIQLQAISVGAGVLVTAIIALTLRGEEQTGKRPLWPMFLPVVCGVFAMGIYYALMIGSPQVIDMLVIQGYSVGAGTLLILLISIPFWRGMRPAVSFAGVCGEQNVAEHGKLVAEYENLRDDAVAEPGQSDSKSGPWEPWKQEQTGDILLEETQDTVPGSETSGQETYNESDKLADVTPGQEEVELQDGQEQQKPLDEEPTDSSVPDKQGNGGTECDEPSDSMAGDTIAQTNKESGVKKISTKLDMLAEIQKQLEAVKAEVELSNNEMVSAVLDRVLEINTLVSECREHRQVAQETIKKAVQNLQAADDKMVQIEQKVETIRSAIAKKITE